MRKPFYSEHEGKVLKWVGWPEDWRNGSPWAEVTGAELQEYLAAREEEQREAERQRAEAETRRAESEARRAEWERAIVTALAAEEERRGCPIYSGWDDSEGFEFDLEPNDALNETGAATLG